jgi:hypothetical protein
LTFLSAFNALTISKAILFWQKLWLFDFPVELFQLIQPKPKMGVVFELGMKDILGL